MPHRYTQAGTYTITARLGRRVAQKQVTILPAPTRWSPPAGWIQPSGWTPNNGGATFYPCQDVTWFFDRIDEPSDRIHMIDDVRTALTMLASETDLTFTEVASEADAVMDIHWKDLPVLDSGVGIAGQSGGGNGTATVWFSRTEPYASDSHGGVALDDGWGNELPGRVWLAVHEIMHAIGFSHTQDFTEIMYHTALNARFGNGDLDGLHTMYRDQPCLPS